IGHPIANTQIYLLDPNLQPVPIGGAGELHIGGDGLSWGYLKRPVLTAEKFIPDPFSKHGGARLYKTGDLAKYRHDGTIEFLGRVDFQVKVRGFRIELGEIDLALSQHPAVREVVTVARDDAGNKRLVAYIVGEQKNKGTREQTGEPRTKNQEPGCPLGAEPRTENQEQSTKNLPSPAAAGKGGSRVERDGGEGLSKNPGEGLSSTELRNYLKGKLPEYMVPSAFVVLPAFPLTPNGKVDRKALPAPDSARPDLRAAYVAPRNEDEQRLAEIWAQVLGVEQVGVQDNFFDLGGDSLLAIRVVAKAGQAGLSITTKQLFQNQTIAELVAKLGSVTIIADQGIVTGPLTWTFSERDFLLREDPNPNYYSIACLLEAEEDLDPALVQTALRQLMLHHDALRVRQPLGADGPTLVIDPPSDELPFTEVDLSDLSEARQGAAIKARITEIQTTFDLEAGPLAKFVLFTLGPDRPNRLLLVCHYYVADLLSWQILLTDLDLAYRQLRRGEAIKLPPKTTSRAQWGQRINEHAHSAAVKDELRYWLSDSRKHAALIPQDHPGGSHTIETYRPVSLYLTAEETHTLMREVKLAQGIQIDDVLLTALLLTITDWAETRSVLVDLLGHGREALFEDMDVSRTMGWLNITYPVLLERAASSDLGPMLKAVRDQMRRIPNHGIGYSLLRYLNTEPEIAAEMDALPPVEVNFNYMGALSPGLSSFRVASAFGGHRLDLQAVRPHLLAINGTLVGDRLSMNWMYSENVHERSTIELLAKNYNATLKALVAYLHERRTQ
ncbi:MAG TPA: condensation domain-containing protein, partial [Herpetosiphonaceae bacterium]